MINGSWIMDKSLLGDHWDTYEQYKNHQPLANESEKYLKDQIRVMKNVTSRGQNLSIYSRQIVKIVLEQLSKSNYPSFQSNLTMAQILGMQLCDILLKDTDDWHMRNVRPLGKIYTRV